MIFYILCRICCCDKGIHSPLYVVKGDGSLASAAYAADHPVELIHSGPATSAIGGSYLAGTQAALVVDIGGTTTDLTLTGSGAALPGEGEATVGGYRTALRTIRAHSFGLGGDSLIRFDPAWRDPDWTRTRHPAGVPGADLPIRAPGIDRMAGQPTLDLVF